MEIQIQACIPCSETQACHWNPTHTSLLSGKELNNFLHDDHSLVWKINTSFETVASLTVLWNDQWTKIISALKTTRISSTAQGYVISEKNEMLCEEGLRRGLSDFWYPGASTSGEGQGDFSEVLPQRPGIGISRA